MATGNTLAKPRSLTISKIIAQPSPTFWWLAAMIADAAASSSGAVDPIITPMGTLVISSGSRHLFAHQRQKATESAIVAALMIEPNDRIQVIGMVLPKNTS